MVLPPSFFFIVGMVLAFTSLPREKTSPLPLRSYLSYLPPRNEQEIILGFLLRSAESFSPLFRLRGCRLDTLSPLPPLFDPDVELILPYREPIRQRRRPFPLPTWRFPERYAAISPQGRAEISIS